MGKLGKGLDSQKANEMKSESSELVNKDGLSDFAKTDAGRNSEFVAHEGKSVKKDVKNFLLGCKVNYGRNSFSKNVSFDWNKDMFEDKSAPFDCLQNEKNSMEWKPKPIGDFVEDKLNGMFEIKSRIKFSGFLQEKKVKRKLVKRKSVIEMKRWGLQKKSTKKAYRTCVFKCGEDIESQSIDISIEFVVGEGYKMKGKEHEFGNHIEEIDENRIQITPHTNDEDYVVDLPVRKLFRKRIDL